MSTALGTQFNLLHGFNINWLHDGAQSGLPFYAIESQNLVNSFASQTRNGDRPYFGDWIQLSFHSDFSDLFGEFLSIWKFEQESYKSSAFTKQPNFSDDQAAKNAIAELLGIPARYVGSQDKGFVLARYWKILQTTDMGQISANGTLSLEQEFSQLTDKNDAIKLFTKYGTHYLSGYSTGDLIYQVFVYDKEVYEDVYMQYPQTSDYLFGRSGDHFRLFTQKRYTVADTLTVGYTEHIGSVLALSRDPYFDTIRHYLKDEHYDVSESIFKFILDFSVAQKTNQMNKTIQVELNFSAISNKSLSSMDLKHNWDEAVMTTTFQKFGREVSPDFRPVPAPNYFSYMDTFNPSLVTSTATTHTSIIHMNFNLQDLRILNPKFVTDLFIFADVIEIHPGNAVNLPGQNSVHIICREFVSHSSGDSIPEVFISTDNFKIISSRFVGVLSIVDNTNMTHLTISDGLVYNTVRDPTIPGLFTVSAFESVTRLPTPSIIPDMYNKAPSNYHERWLTRTFLNALELEMVSVQNILSIRANDREVEAAEQSLSWITQTLSNDNTKLSTDLEAVLCQALVINKTRESEYLRQALVVPRLTYPEYEDLYNNMLTLVHSYEHSMATVANEISKHKQNEAIASTQAELNDNIRSIGNFLVKQVKVATEHQQDVINYHKEIDRMKLNEIAQQDAKAREMLTEVTEYQARVKEAGEALKLALDKWQTEQIVREAFEIIGAVGSLFSGGVNIAALPAGATNIARVAAKIEYVVEVIKQISALYEQGRNIRTDANNFNRATEFLDRTVFSPSDYPNELEWSDFDSDILSMTLGLPTSAAQVTAKALDFRTAANKLSARGRAYLNLQKKVQALKSEKILNELQRDVVDRHVSRLTELQSSLSQSALSDSEANNTDLFELGNILMMRANVIRTKLAQTFVTMDAALQYYYLQDPTPITGYDILTIQEAAVHQISNSIAALSAFPSKPHDLSDPISYDIPNVKVSSLQSKQGFQQRIPLSAIEFQDYLRVRVIEIEIRVDNVVSSANDTVYIEAEASGEIIQDRDLHRKTKTFASYPVKYPFVYNHLTGKTTVGNRPSPQFIDKYMRMTPFVEWTFKIPEVLTNSGIQFSSELTTLHLKFHVSAIFHPLRSRLARSPTDLSGSLNTLLDDMDGNTVVGDWDAVCAMDAKEINRLWKQKYDYEVNNGGFVTNVETEYKIATETRNTIIKRALSATVGPPKLSFIQHNANYATLEMTVTNAVLKTREYCKEGSRRCTDPTEIWDEYEEVMDVNDAKINATIQMAKIDGNVTTLRKIMLDFSDAVFDFKLVGLDDDTHIALRSSITTWFKNFQTQAYELGTVDFDSKLTPASLQPHRFYFSTGGFVNSPDGLGTLLIFIKTNAVGSSADETTTRDFSIISKDKHIIPKGYTSAMFIASRVIFQDMIKPQFENQVGVGTTAQKSGAYSFSAWTVKGSGSGSLRNPVTIQYSIWGGGTTSYNLNIPTSDFEIKASRTGLKFDWSSSFDSTIKYRKESCGLLICSYSYKDVTKRFHINAHATSAPSVDTATSVISFPPMNLGAALSFDKSSGWQNFCCDGTLKDDAAQRTVNVVNNKLSSLTLNIQDVSVFALTNLIFPGAKVMNLYEVYIPGDVLVLGNITKNYSPTP